MYRLYVDEVGTDHLTNLDKDKHRYLSLSGVAMRVDYVRNEFTKNLDWIKAKVFEHDPDSPLIFHRKEILGFKGPYEISLGPFAHQVDQILWKHKYDRSSWNGKIVGYGMKHLP